MSTTLLMLMALSILPYILVIFVVIQVGTLWQKQLLDTRVGALIVAISLLLPLLGPLIGWYMLRQAKAATPAYPLTLPRDSVPADERPPV